MIKFNWIKMGLRTGKILLLLVIVMMLTANVDKDYRVKTEEFSFNRTFNMTAMAEKEKEEKPIPVIIKEDKKTNEVKENKKNKENKENSAVLLKLTGDLTGYAADCPACNGKLACKRDYKVYKNGVLTYPDKTYGNVRIVASSKKTPCGSIIKFNFKALSSEPVYAIVLDRGVLGNDIDLLMPTEKDASKYIGRHKITYEVVRRGW